MTTVLVRSAALGLAVAGLALWGSGSTPADPNPAGVLGMNDVYAAWAVTYSRGRSFGLGADQVHVRPERCSFVTEVLRRQQRLAYGSGLGLGSR